MSEYISFEETFQYQPTFNVETDATRLYSDLFELYKDEFHLDRKYKCPIRSAFDINFDQPDTSTFKADNAYDPLLDYIAWVLSDLYSWDPYDQPIELTRSYENKQQLWVIETPLVTYRLSYPTEGVSTDLFTMNDQNGTLLDAMKLLDLLEEALEIEQQKAAL